MDEAELTRKAIEEIMREMNAQKETDKMPNVLERKFNPLGRPNKDFLDRTINSVMTHNKRQLERNHRKCQNKLKDLDESKSYLATKRGGRERSKITRKKKHKYKRSQFTASSSSSSSGTRSSSKERKTKHKKCKKKKKRTKKRESSKSVSSSRSSSSSLSLDTSSSSSASGSNKSKRKRIERNNQENYKEDNLYPYQNEHLDPNAMGYFVDPNATWAAMAYSQMQQLLQQQQQSMQDLLKEEFEDVSDHDGIPSDLSLNDLSAESELNISLNSSSAEEDENGVLTFKLTSDEEKTTTTQSAKLTGRRKQIKQRNEQSKLILSKENKITISDTSSSESEEKHSTKSENVTFISSTSDSDSNRDIRPHGRAEITTILSSSSCSEAESCENVQKQEEEITIISSCCSSSEDENDVVEKKQEEIESNFSSRDKDKDLQKEEEEYREKTNEESFEDKEYVTSSSHEMVAAPINKDENVVIADKKHEDMSTQKEAEEYKEKMKDVSFKDKEYVTASHEMVAEPSEKDENEFIADKNHGDMSTQKEAEEYREKTKDESFEDKEYVRASHEMIAEPSEKDKNEVIADKKYENMSTQDEYLRSMKNDHEEDDDNEKEESQETNYNIVANEAVSQTYISKEISGESKQEIGFEDHSYICKIPNVDNDQLKILDETKTLNTQEILTLEENLIHDTKRNAALNTTAKETESETEQKQTKDKNVPLIQEISIKSSLQEQVSLSVTIEETNLKPSAAECKAIDGTAKDLSADNEKVLVKEINSVVTTEKLKKKELHTYIRQQGLND